MEYLEPNHARQCTLPGWGSLAIVPRTLVLGLDQMTLDFGQEALHVCSLHFFLVVVLERARFFEL